MVNHQLAEAFALGTGCFESPTVTEDVAAAPQNLPPQSVTEFLLCGPTLETDSTQAERFLATLGQSLVGSSVAPFGGLHG